MAIKVVRSIRKYRDAAMIEIDVLQHLAKNDKGCSSQYVSCGLQLIETFLMLSCVLTFPRVGWSMQLCADSKLV